MERLKLQKGEAMNRNKKEMCHNMRSYLVILALSTIATTGLPHNVSRDLVGDDYHRFLMKPTSTIDQLSVPIIKLSPEIKNEIQEYLNSTADDLTLFMVYIAADNDLRSFAIRNIKQMTRIGSNKNLIILVHLDIRLKKNKKVTRRYLVLKDRVIHLNADDKQTQRMDSGNPNTLISFCKFAIETFPAQKHALILWDHGTGTLDPKRGRIVRAHERFTFNPKTEQYDLDRSSSYLDLIEPEEGCCRGICWDDTTGHYLSSRDLDFALNKITNDFLGGKKLNILAFDACLMSMLEVASIAKHYAKIMISSQEVILGPGFQYTKTLAPFEHGSLTHVEFAQHIVQEYGKVYNTITSDYTLSAIDLQGVEDLEKNVDEVAQLLKKCLSRQIKRSVKKAIYASRSNQLCTHFDEKSYIDLDHFYRNLLKNLNLFRLSDKRRQPQMIEELRHLLEEGREIIRTITIANAVGKKLSNARGLSIYFPEKSIHNSYPQVPFSQNNAWPSFLAHYHKY